LSISVYKAETVPVAAYYKKHGKYSAIVGVGDVDHIFFNLCREIDNHISL
jgi:adenylate kinase